MPAVLTVNETYEIIKYILNKNQMGNLPPESFNTIINQAQWGYFRYLLGEYQKYQPGRPIAPVEFSQNAYVRESLTPFIQQPSTLTIDPATGRTPYPANYEMWDAMYWGIYQQPVKFIQQDRLGSHLKSYVRPIATNPVFLSIYTGFQLHPINIGATELSYIRTPQTIQWGFTNDIYGRPIYSPATSQDPQWRRPDMMDVIARALQFVGVNLQVAQVENFANQIKMVGQ